MTARSGRVLAILQMVRSEDGVATPVRRMLFKCDEGPTRCLTSMIGSAKHSASSLAPISGDSAVPGQTLTRVSARPSRFRPGGTFPMIATVVLVLVVVAAVRSSGGYEPPTPARGPRPHRRLRSLSAQL